MRIQDNRTGIHKEDASIEDLLPYIGHYVVGKYRIFDQHRRLKLVTFRGILQYVGVDEWRIKILPDGKVNPLTILPDDIPVIYPKGPYKNRR